MKKSFDIGGIILYNTEGIVTKQFIWMGSC